MATSPETGIDRYRDDDIVLGDIDSAAPLLDPSQANVASKLPEAPFWKRMRRGKKFASSPAMCAVSVIVVISLLVLGTALHSGAQSERLLPWSLPWRSSWSSSLSSTAALSKYRWKTPPVDATLARRIDELSLAQRRVRSWLFEQRLETTGGVGIGLASLGSLAPRRSNDYRKHAFALPAESKGPGVYTSGSRDKYDDLLFEWRFGRPVGACESGDWQLPYARMHAEMLSGARDARLLEYVCLADHHCGGYADRMLGMTTAILLSILSGRAFLAHWGQPTPLDLVFDSPFIDWSRPYNTSSGDLDKASAVPHEALHWYQVDDTGLDAWMSGILDHLTAYDSPPLFQLDANRGTVLRSFTYPNFRPHLERLGFTSANAYSCLINYAFRPKPAALAFITEYTSYFALPENFVVGIQIRLAINRWSAREASDSDRHTVRQFQHYFTCAEQLAETYARPTQKVIYYLITDSDALEQDAKRLLGERLIVTGLEQAHAEIHADSSNGDNEVLHAADGLMRTIAESWIFAGTDYQILTANSGFGKIPTWLRGRDNSTILDPHLDCSLPSTLRTFVDMAQGWSLG